jgi:hypothetical protein
VRDQISSTSGRTPCYLDEDDDNDDEDEDEDEDDDDDDDDMYSEDTGNIFFRYVSAYFPDYTVSHYRRSCSSN